jgi:hypothetical protein
MSPSAPDISINPHYSLTSHAEITSYPHTISSLPDSVCASSPYLITERSVKSLPYYTRKYPETIAALGQKQPIYIQDMILKIKFSR